uniref:Ig-like domain-containing protein n=1 Tax=Plectus sambesii TaxID=2011161 RepID=A0A914VPM3_9BILA
MRRDDALTQVWLCAVCQPTRHSDVMLVALTTTPGRGNNEAEEALQSTSCAHNTPVGLVLLSILPPSRGYMRAPFTVEPTARPTLSSARLAPSSAAISARRAGRSLADTTGALYIPGASCTKRHSAGLIAGGDRRICAKNRPIGRRPAMRPPVVSSLQLLLLFGVGGTLASPVTLSTPDAISGSFPDASNTLIKSDERVERAIGEQWPEGGKKKLKEQEIIQRILKDYDWRVRPLGSNTSWPDTGGPVMVVVNIYLRSISKIDDVNMEYSAQFTFREQWTDPRLAYKRLADDQTLIPPFVVLATSEQGTDQQIWMPDTFFQNEKEARRHMIDKPNVLIRIYPDGAILYSVRLSLVLSCPMSLEFYPLDRQSCLIDLASYAYTTEDIKYEWKSENPIQQKDGLRQSLPSFELQDVLTEYCTSKTNTGEYSCLRTRLILRREFSYYLLQLYIPSFMLVIVSWVSFWLDKDSVPARVTLGVTTLLTMTTQSSGINAKLPPVSYTKAIDVWIGVCLAFIFGALLEFALVNYAARKDMMLESRGRAMRSAARPAGRATRATLHPPTSVALDDYEVDGREQQLASCNNAFVMTPLLQKPLRPELIPYNYHPALLPPQMNHRQPTLSMNAPSSPMMLNRGSPDMVTIASHIFIQARRIVAYCHRFDFITMCEYSCARVKLMLRREYSYYLIQLYIPSFMLVVVSWVSFWLDKDAVPARVSLGVTTLLTMTTQASGINAKLPPVSYTKAVDVWIGVCLGFIFGALLEFALVNYYGRMEFLKKEKKAKKFKDQNVNMLMPGMIAAPFVAEPARKSLSPQPSSSPFVPADPQLDVGCPQCNDEAEQIHWQQQQQQQGEPRLFGVLQRQATLLNRPLMPIPLDLSMHPKRQRQTCCRWTHKWLKKYNERSKRIDILSRVIFPIGFFFFNCFYWTYYFSKDK